MALEQIFLPKNESELAGKLAPIKSKYFDLLPKLDEWDSITRNEKAAEGKNSNAYSRPPNIVDILWTRTAERHYDHEKIRSRLICMDPDRLELFEEVEPASYAPLSSLVGVDQRNYYFLNEQSMFCLEKEGEAKKIVAKNPGHIRMRLDKQLWVAENDKIYVFFEKGKLDNLAELVETGDKILLRNKKAREDRKNFLFSSRENQRFFTLSYDIDPKKAHNIELAEHTYSGKHILGGFNQNCEGQTGPIIFGFHAHRNVDCFFMLYRHGL
jgi:hypothetical protein